MSRLDTKGKVVLAIVTGTWRPNCHDEAQFLVQLDKKYRDKGLAIVALDFEEPEQQGNLERERAFVKHYGVQYTYLIAGAPAQMWEKVPQAVNLNSWPTTIFVGRDGLVKGIHTGFASPASGEYNNQLKEEFTAKIEKLLAEKPAPANTTAAAPVAVLLVFGLVPDLAQSTEPDVIVTASPAYAPLAALRGEERFPNGARLLLVHQGKPEPLAPGFTATADADVSFDAKTVLFSGKRGAGDPWQVWELTLADRSVRKVIEGAGDAIRPLYLPFDRVVFARRASRGFQLESAAIGKPDADAGAAPLQLTYLPGSAIPADVLQDGRILFEAGFPLGSGPTPELFLVYADGSGVESYRCDHGAARWGGRQLASGDVVFTHGPGLARFTSPLAAEAPINAPSAEYSGAIAETASGAWLVSARTGEGAHYTLNSWKPGAAALQPVLAEGGLDLVEPVLVAPRGRPKRHPSALHEWNYANLLALDARQSREGDLKSAPVSVRLETMDAEGRTVVAGEATVEEDGSFFVKTPADTPMRFSLLDENGAVVRREQGWFWIRRGEQRICVGCHTGPERASRNKVPDALLRSTRPADLTRADAGADAQLTARGGK